MAFSLYAVATFAFVVASLAEDPAAVSAPEPAAAEPGQAWSSTYELGDAVVDKVQLCCMS
ncbi:unnamed protein product [Symbiodinium natans]|uniref:Uncharacterized protein n=1 Tax=Symbiodinium natans TaxID=878477 RepID=A0A812NV00_9DINO|nr:unnamed protein product [Symbiodinium natans]